MYTTGMYLIVGLGNPGAEHAGTRHNAGAEAVERFRERFGFPSWERNKYMNALLSEGAVAEARVTLLLPQTYMNRSGEAVRQALQRGRGKSPELIVVHDDLDLPVRRLKIVFGRGAGGHHGVESIIQCVGGKDFTRLRIGIAPREVARVADGREFVLGRFSPAEQEEMQVAFAKCVDALASLVSVGRDSAMQRYNMHA